MNLNYKRVYNASTASISAGNQSTEYKVSLVNHLAASCSNNVTCESSVNVQQIAMHSKIKFFHNHYS